MTLPSLAESTGYVTGHCGNGCHEGQKVLSPRGELMTACRGVYNFRMITIKCRCFCHDMYAMMRDLDPDAFAVPSESTPLPISAVTVDPVAFDVLPVLPGARVGAVPDEHKIYRKLLDGGNVSEQLANFVRSSVFNEEVTDTEVTEASGERRRRGELEANVEVICRLWLDKKIPWPELDTHTIGLFIDAEDPPSQGAIYAVLLRWSSAAYAVIGMKPMRFLSFSDAVMVDGIEALKVISARTKNARARGFF